MGMPVLTCTMLSLGSRLQSANVSWSPSRKRRWEIRRWGSQASSYSRGALRYSSSFSRALSRLRCSAAGWAAARWVRAAPCCRHGTRSFAEPSLPRSLLCQPALVPALFLPGPGWSLPVLPRVPWLSCAEPHWGWGAGGTRMLRDGQGRAGQPQGSQHLRACLGFPSVAQHRWPPHFLTFILGGHWVLNEGGELVEDVIASQP